MRPADCAPADEGTDAGGGSCAEAEGATPVLSSEGGV